MEDTDWGVRDQAIRTFYTLGWNGYPIGTVLFALICVSGDANHVQQALQAIKFFLSDNHFLSSLEGAQKKLEHDMAEWQRKQARTCDPEAFRCNAHIQLKSTRVLQAIVACKSKLAKERGGELLAGETVPKPVYVGKRVYLVLARRL